VADPRMVGGTCSGELLRIYTDLGYTKVRSVAGLEILYKVYRVGQLKTIGVKREAKKTTKAISFSIQLLAVQTSGQAWPPT